MKVGFGMNAYLVVTEIVESAITEGGCFNITKQQTSVVWASTMSQVIYKMTFAHDDDAGSLFRTVIECKLLFRNNQRYFSEVLIDETVIDKTE